VLTDIVNDDSSVSAPIAERLVKALMTDIATDNIPLFVTLIRFNYALPEAKAQS
jgi:hypothetical protein